jgi:hypothetical protein
LGSPRLRPEVRRAEDRRGRRGTARTAGGLRDRPDCRGGAAGPPGLPGDCGRVAGAGDLVVFSLRRERDTSKKFNYVQ